MILLGLGTDVPESRLRAECDSTILGTDALKAVDAARRLGLVSSAKHTLTTDELRNLVSEGKYPIVFVSLLPIDARDDTHALVVTEFVEEDILMFDPLAGERVIPLQTFDAAWGMQHNLALVIAH